MSQNTSSAVMQQRHEAHDSLDFFPTPPWATRALCACLAEADPALKGKRAWDPACGTGDMVRPLSEFFELAYGSDVHPYGAGAVRDFLLHGDEPVFDWIITNPPFRLAEEFAEKMIGLARCGAAILVRTAFLEGVGRHSKLFSRRPPQTILQFVERVPMHRGRLVENGSTATAYCWIVWLCRPHKPVPADRTAFAWIPPCRRILERPGDYALVAA
ncbi:methyltransferase [uncultured Enterovirga sp.]|uniref:methyltransferase n=1 Tax=uncultured Enterovirga sp. TaxID=2026352 RepID=UPI0035CA76BB